MIVCRSPLIRLFSPLNIRELASCSPLIRLLQVVHPWSGPCKLFTPDQDLASCSPQIRHLHVVHPKSGTCKLFTPEQALASCSPWSETWKLFTPDEALASCSPLIRHLQVVHPWSGPCQLFNPDQDLASCSLLNSQAAAIQIFESTRNHHYRETWSEITPSFNKASRDRHVSAGIRTLLKSYLDRLHIWLFDPL